MNVIQRFFRDLLAIGDPVMNFAHPEAACNPVALDVLRHRALDIWTECAASMRFNVFDFDQNTGALTANRTSTLSRRLTVKPNAMQTLPAFVAHAAERYLRIGKTVVVAIRDDRGGIKELVCAQTADRVPNAPGWWQVVLPDWYDPEQSVRTVGPDDVGLVERQGGGCAWSLALTGAELGGGAVASLARYQQKMVRPSNVLYTDSSLNATQVEQIRGAMSERHGDTAVFAHGLKPMAPPVSPVNAESAKTVEIGAKLVSLAFGVPESMLGVLVPGSTSTASEMLSQFKATTFSGWSRSLAAALAALGGLPVDAVEADLSQLTTLDRLDRLEKLTGAVQGLIMRPNEARAVVGLSPDPAGERLYGQRQLTPAEQLGTDLTPTV